MKLILIAGGSGSGKSTLASAIAEKLGGPERVTIIHHDNYFLDASGDTFPNFDRLAALDNGEFVRDIAALERGEEIRVPIYDYNLRKPVSSEVVRPTHWVIAEGLYPLAIPAVRKLADFRIFIEVDPVLQLARRLLRDAVPGGRLEHEPLHEQIDRYVRFVKPEYDRIIAPSSKWADLVTNNNSDGPETMIRDAWDEIDALRGTFSE